MRLPSLLPFPDCLSFSFFSSRKDRTHVYLLPLTFVSSEEEACDSPQNPHPRSSSPGAPCSARRRLQGSQERPLGLQVSPPRLQPLRDFSGARTSSRGIARLTGRSRGLNFNPSTPRGSGPELFSPPLFSRSGLLRSHLDALRGKLLAQLRSLQQLGEAAPAQLCRNCLKQYPKMHNKEILLSLWVLMFSSTSESCISRSYVTAVAGEFFYLEDCAPPNQNTSTVKWYKSSDSLEFVELTSSSSPRIVLQNYRLEFWPLELDDSGYYKFYMGNDSYHWTLKVIRRSNDKCYSENLKYSKSVTVGSYLSVKCKEKNFASLTNKILLHKDCETNMSDVTFIKQNAQIEDRGHYTCTYFFHHNGKEFTATETESITITEDESIITPYLLGPKTELIEVELGKDIQLNCSAFVADMDYYIDWEYENFSNVHVENSSRDMSVGNKKYSSKILKIAKVNEKNLNAFYNCCLVWREKETKTFTLVRKGMADISDHVFTRGMIVAVFISVAIVCLVTLGIIYRVDLVLFYRHLMRRDETLTDGKFYDAFVSYLKESQTENGEAHTFAVEILPRVLEKQFGYKLCIFERDVVPGKAIVDEIHSLIEKSRRLIIVLSKSDLSNEVRYELESGLHEALVERKIKIIVIKFTSVSDFTFLPQSLELLKSHRVLKWKDDKSLSYNSRFWKNLLYLMPAKVNKPLEDEGEFLSIFS